MPICIKENSWSGGTVFVLLHLLWLILFEKKHMLISSFELSVTDIIMGMDKLKRQDFFKECQELIANYQPVTNATIYYILDWQNYLFWACMQF